MAISSVKHVFAGVKRALQDAVSGLFSGGWKLVVLRFALLGAVLASGGFLFSWSGLAPTSAHSKHWPITYWFLHFSLRQAVETRSSAIQVPSLEDEAKILKGAGHYATNCAPCHGAPGVKQNYGVRFMTPKPPYLPPKIKEWESAELFWIVRNGIKFSAMPSWPSYKRTDEVWAMVAFLKQLPDMTAERYQQLAYGPRQTEQVKTVSAHSHEGHQHAVEQEALDRVLDDCSRCHGRDGRGRGAGAFPKLAGQKVEYLRASLRAFASGERHSGIMQPVAANLNDDMIDVVSEHYSRMNEGLSAHHGFDEGDHAPLPMDNEANPSLNAISRGEVIATTGVRNRGIPPCNACHGLHESPQNKVFPRLAGQYPDYLELQLSLFKSHTRGGTSYSPIMSMIAERLSKEEIHDLAAYYGSLKYFGSED